MTGLLEAKAPSFLQSIAENDPYIVSWGKTIGLSPGTAFILLPVYLYLELSFCKKISLDRLAVRPDSYLDHLHRSIRSSSQITSDQITSDYLCLLCLTDIPISALCNSVANPEFV